MTLGNDITFLIRNKLSFDLPLSSVSNSNIAGKNEVALEFTPPVQTSEPAPTSAGVRLPDELIEMRFYVPGKSMKGGGDDDEEGEGDEGMETEVDEDGNEVSAAEAMHNTIKEKADIGGVVGESIVVFEDVLILTPRWVRVCSSRATLTYLSFRPIRFPDLYIAAHRPFL
jgi:structure-specific recognition protein 1